MSVGVRVLTLLVAAAVFAIGGITGVQLLTAGTGDVAEATATCTPKVVAAGTALDSNVVTVNVFNASNRSGLANRALIDLQKNGFLGGRIGNSESATQPNRVAILTDDPADPRVALVAAQFKDKVEYAAVDIDVENGVVVVVGDNYRGLKDGAPTATETDRDISVCVPVVPVP